MTSTEMSMGLRKGPILPIVQTNGHYKSSVEIREVQLSSVGHHDCREGITPHVLRHAYATYSRKQIEALRQLMGHVSIETTAGYRHPVVEQASNPLYDLFVVTRSQAGNRPCRTPI